MFQSSPDFRLKNHDSSYHPVRNDLVHQPRQGVQTNDFRYDSDNNKNSYTFQKLNRFCASQQLDQFVYKIPDNQNIKYVHQKIQREQVTGKHLLPIVQIKKFPDLK